MRPQRGAASNMPILLTTTNNLVLIDIPVSICLTVVDLLAYLPAFFCRRFLLGHASAVQGVAQ